MRHGWLPKYVLPSLPDFLFVALVGAFVAFAGETLLADADFGWHIRAGDQLLLTRRFIRTDVFGHAGQPWFAWEWLSEVAMSLAHRVGQLRGLVLLSAIVIAATFRGLYAALLARGANVYVALAVVLASVVAADVHALARPHLVSWYFVLLFYLLLDDFDRGKKPARALAWAPALIALWVNLHGGFVVAFLLAGIFLVANLLERSPKAKPLGLMLAAMAAASLLSPYGPRLHAHIIKYLGNSYLMNSIDEFRSPDFHGAPGLCLALLFVASVAAPAYSGVKLRLRDALVLAFAIVFALYAGRNIPLSVLLISLVVTPHLSAWAAATPRLAALEGRSTAVRQANAALRSPLFALAAVAVFVVLAAQKKTHADFPASRFPLAGARSYLGSHPEIDRLVVPDYYSGYVLYYFAPRIVTLIDDRHDFYGADIVRDDIALHTVKPGWKDILERGQAAYALLPESAALAQALRETHTWSVAFDDGKVVLFARRVGYDGPRR